MKRTAHMIHLMVGFLITILAVDVWAGELEVRDAIYADTIELYKAKDFATLEKRAEHYRESEEKTSSGTWKLAHFYRAFTNLFDENIRSRAFWGEQLAMSDEWVAAYPKSPTPYIVHAMAIHGEAGSHRGTGWASSVPKENWAPYKEGSRNALRYLREHSDIASRDPHWYNTLSNVHKSLGTDKKTYWADISEGLRKFPYYNQIYFAAATFFAPIWHGSPEDIQWLAQEAVKRTKDKLGYAMYARTYWATPADRYGRLLLLYPPADWDLIKAGMDDVLRDYPDQWNINNFAYFACSKGDAPKAKELMSKVIEPPNATAWHGAKNYYQCKTALQNL